MEAAAGQQDLLFIAEILQKRLQSELPQAVSLQVQCAIKDGSLIVLSQHPETGAILDPESTFAALHLTLQSLQPLVAQPVQLYLKVAGKKQPYATYSFTLQPPVSLQVWEQAEVETREDKQAFPAQSDTVPNLWGETKHTLLSDSVRMTEADSEESDPLATFSPNLSDKVVPVMRFSEGNGRSPGGDWWLLPVWRFPLA